MTADYALTLAQETLYVALLVGAPLLGLGLAAGVLVSVFQAATQINEQSLSFVPKILATLAAIALFGPWMLSTLTDFATRLFERLPHLVR